MNESAYDGWDEGYEANSQVKIVDSAADFKWGRCTQAAVDTRWRYPTVEVQQESSVDFAAGISVLLAILS